MTDFEGLAGAIKAASTGAVSAAMPVAVLFGSVASEIPLEITVDQKMALTGEQLVLTKTVKNALAIGDTVALIRIQGGQKFLVVDRIEL